jgi:hypothetical protein
LRNSNRNICKDRGVDTYEGAQESSLDDYAGGAAGEGVDSGSDHAYDTSNKIKGILLPPVRGRWYGFNKGNAHKSCRICRVIIWGACYCVIGEKVHLRDDDPCVEACEDKKTTKERYK